MLRFVSLEQCLKSKFLQKDSSDQLRPKAKIETDIERCNQRIKNIEDDYADRKLDAGSFDKTFQRYGNGLDVLHKEVHTMKTRVSAKKNRATIQNLWLPGNVENSGQMSNQLLKDFEKLTSISP